MKAKVSIKPEKNGTYTVEVKDLGIAFEGMGTFEDMLVQARNAIRVTLRDEFGTMHAIGLELESVKVAAVFDVFGGRPETPLSAFIPETEEPRIAEACDVSE